MPAASKGSDEKFGQVLRFPDIGQADIGPFHGLRIIGGPEQNIPDCRAAAEILVEVLSLDRMVNTVKAIVGKDVTNPAQIQSR